MINVKTKVEQKFAINKINKIVRNTFQNKTQSSNLKNLQKRVLKILQPCFLGRLFLQNSNSFTHTATLQKRVLFKQNNKNFGGILYTSLQKQTSINYKVFNDDYQNYFKSSILQFTLKVKILLKSIKCYIYKIFYFKSDINKININTFKVNCNLKYKLLKYYSNIIIRDYDIKNREKYISYILQIAKKYHLNPIVAIKKSCKSFNANNFKIYCSGQNICNLNLMDKKNLSMSSIHNIKDIIAIKKSLRNFNGKFNDKQNNFLLAISPVFKTTTHAKAIPLGYLKFFKLANLARQILGQGVNIYALGGVNLQNIKKLNNFAKFHSQKFQISSISFDL